MNDSTPSVRVPKVPLVCAECGTGFALYPSQLGRGRGRYCSRSCHYRASRRGSLVYCDLCDTAFYRAIGEQMRDGKCRQFCSRDCYGGWRVLHRLSTSYPKVGAIHRHRVVAESVLGRLLRAGEVVHHIDLDRQNCDPANLAVFPSQSAHARCHAGSMSDDELRGFSLLEIAHRADGRR